MLDEDDFVSIDMPLNFEILFAIQSDVGATRQELELLEDLKWTMRAWRASQERYLPITLRDIWEVASDGVQFADMIQHRPLGPLTSDEKALLRGIFQLFDPRELADIRIGYHNTFYNGRRIGWTDSDVLLNVGHVVGVIFKHHGLSASNMDTMPLAGLAIRLNDASYCEQLWAIDNRHITPETCHLAACFFWELEQWVAAQAAAA